MAKKKYRNKKIDLILIKLLAKGKNKSLLANLGCGLRAAHIFLYQL